MPTAKITQRRFRGICFPTSKHPEIRKAKRAGLQPSIHGTKLWKSSALLIEYLKNNQPMYSEQVIDVGCGWGAGGIWCAKKLGSKVTSMDADQNVFRFLEITANMNKVSTTHLTMKFEKLRKKDLKKYDLLIAADICFWDELVNPVYNMVNRAIKAGVKQILITDPERPTFLDMADRCLNKFGGELLDIETNGSIDAKGSILVLNNF